jgi:predicted nucleotidyltransferase
MTPHRHDKGEEDRIAGITAKACVAVTDFYRPWRITELSLFGAVLRDDFRPDRDLDVRATPVRA